MSDPSPVTSWSAGQTTAIVFLAGFAIQQLLQILDPWIIIGINKIKAARAENDLPGGMADVDFKKAAIALISFLLGAIAVQLSDIRLLALINSDYAGAGDFLVSALVLGTGTEAVNTVIKFLGYAKDAKKLSKSIDVAIFPPSTTVKQGTTFKFRANVNNGLSDVTWSVLHGNGGTIDNSGLYTAPMDNGTFLVVAVSTVDPSKHSQATVTVIS